MAKGWKLESARHSLARKGIKTINNLLHPPNLETAYAIVFNYKTGKWKTYKTEKGFVRARKEVGDITGESAYD
jgi:hypothetical protein